MKVNKNILFSILLMFLIPLFLCGDFDTLWLQIEPSLNKEVLYYDENETEIIDRDTASLYAELKNIYNNPININTCKKRELFGLPLLSAPQINAIEEYRNKQFISDLNQLSDYEIINDEEYEILRHFLNTINPYKTKKINISIETLSDLSSEIIQNETINLNINSTTEFEEFINSAGLITDYDYMIPEYSLISNLYETYELYTNGILNENDIIKNILTTEKKYNNEISRYHKNKKQPNLANFYNLSLISNQGLDFKNNYARIDHKIKMNFDNKIEGIIITQRDRFERDYFDLLKYSMILKKIPYVSSICLGALSIDIGQKLLFSTSSRSAGKNLSQVISYRKKTKLDISRSLSEDYLQGAAIRLESRRLSLSGFYGTWKWDGLKLPGTYMGQQEYFKTIKNKPSSYNTIDLYQQKKSQTETIRGGNLDIYLNTLSFIGFSYINSEFAYPIKPDIKHYKYHDYFGKKYYGTSFHWNIYFPKLTLFGETACNILPALNSVTDYNFQTDLTYNDYWGIISGLIFEYSRKFRYLISIRSYPDKFLFFHNKAFADGRPVSQTGIYNAVKWYINKKNSISIFTDIFEKTYRTYTESMPVGGSDLGIEYRWKPIKQLNIFFKEKIKNNEKSIDDEYGVKQTAPRQNCISSIKTEFLQPSYKIKFQSSIYTDKYFNFKKFNYTDSISLTTFITSSFQINSLISYYKALNSPQTIPDIDLPGYSYSQHLSGEGYYLSLIPKINIKNRLSFYIKYHYGLKTTVKKYNYYNFIQKLKTEELKVYLKLNY